MPYCGGKKRSGGTCSLPAGWGTDHVGEGRCKLHAGNAGAPEGNQNARKHGGYSVLRSAFNEEDQAIFDQATADTTQGLDDEIRTLTVREHRILRLMQGGGRDDLHDVLTRIQNAKLRAIEAKAKAEGDRDQDFGQIDDFFQALDADDDTYQPAQ